MDFVVHTDTDTRNVFASKDVSLLEVEEREHGQWRVRILLEPVGSRADVNLIISAKGLREWARQVIAEIDACESKPRKEQA